VGKGDRDRRRIDREGSSNSRLPGAAAIFRWAVMAAWKIQGAPRPSEWLANENGRRRLAAGKSGK